MRTISFYNLKCAREVLWAFLKLGLSSFGGPVAHLGYFRNELVIKRRWLGEAAYADLVALCQFLPGPASSQLGFALGLLRAGLPGALLAWLAFSLPSALLLVGFAHGAEDLTGPWGQSLLHGLQLVAVAVVAHAVLGMGQTLCPDRTRVGIALAALLLALLAPRVVGQLAAIGLGACAGLRLCRGGTVVSGRLPLPYSRRAGGVLLALFAGLLLGVPAALTFVPHQALALFDAFYRAGALVFGGGHVVLPLLEARVVEAGWVGGDSFLVGYGAAQAVPGPLFSFAAYLGAVAEPAPNGWVGALIALTGIFLPGLVLLLGVLPFWDELRQRPRAQGAMAGVNAAVVGILGAALYDPIWTSAVFTGLDFAIASSGFLLLSVWRLAPWLVVLVTTAAAMAAAPLQVL